MKTIIVFLCIFGVSLAVTNEESSGEGLPKHHLPKSLYPFLGQDFEFNFYPGLEGKQEPFPTYFVPNDYQQEATPYFLSKFNRKYYPQYPYSQDRNYNNILGENYPVYNAKNNFYNKFNYSPFAYNKGYYGQPFYQYYAAQYPFAGNKFSNFAYQAPFSSPYYQQQYQLPAYLQPGYQQYQQLGYQQYQQPAYHQYQQPAYQQYQ